MNNPNKEGQVERNIEENSRFVLDKDKEKWIKELKNAKGKLSNITSRYIKRATSEKIPGILAEKLKNLDDEYVPYKNKIKVQLKELSKKITVRNIDNIFSEITKEYKSEIDIKYLKELYTQERKQQQLHSEISKCNKDKIKGIYKEQGTRGKSESLIIELVNQEKIEKDDAIKIKANLTTFISQDAFSKYEIKIPKLHNLTQKRAENFKELIYFILDLDIKDKRKNNLLKLLTKSDENSILLEIISNYTKVDITVALVKSSNDSVKILSFKKTCNYAGIYQTFDLHKRLNLKWSNSISENMESLLKIKEHAESIKEDSERLDSQFLKIMTQIEEKLTKNVFESNPLTEHNWFSRGMHNSIFYEYSRLLFDSKYDKVLADWNESVVDKEAAKSLLEEVPDLKDIYYKARKKIRNIVFYAGETNSGKTYSAFNDLVKHDSGIYLAPLRLLALEGQEEIKKRGKPCSYLTGEESDIDLEAHFTCSTIEMLNIKKEYDCAIIDEIQMIADENRGTAWLEALIGVNADRVLLTGTKAALPIVEKICNYTGDNLTVITLEKKTKLSLDTREINTTNIPDSSAIIAFSKKEIHRIKDMIEEPTAIIYGSLSPEVRRQEAEKFRSGEAKILISTDAIGMGLNLPIENIFFSGIEKYNGVEFGKIKEEEVLQISGRAGRYKLFDEGKVGFIDTGNSFVTKKDSLSYIRKVLEQKISRDVESATFSITRNMFCILSDLLDSQDVKRISRFFFKFMQKKIDQDFIKVTIPNDFYDRMDLVYDTIQEIEVMAGKNDLNITFEDKLNLLFLPLDAAKKSQEGKSVITTFLKTKYMGSKDNIKLPGKIQVDMLPISLLGIEKLERSVHICDLLHNLKLKYPALSLSNKDHEAQKDLYQDAMLKIINDDNFSANCRRCEKPISIGVHTLCDKCFKAGK